LLCGGWWSLLLSRRMINHDTIGRSRIKRVGFGVIGGTVSILFRLLC
jgi:hypothetical protein